MKRILLLLLSFSTVISCSGLKELEPLSLRNPYGSYPIEISCESIEGESSKSSFTDAALTKVSNVCIFVYRGGSLVSDLYFPSGSGISVSFPSASDSYNVYMLANAGDVEAPESEADIADLKCVFLDYGEFDKTGSPMANTFTDYIPGSRTQFKLKRLVGMYSISMDNTSDVVDYEIKSLRMMNCACDIYPFGSHRATSFNVGGDFLSDDDLQELNSGGSVKLYFLENLQGELLPDNTDPKQKIPDNIPDATLAAHCTYIQILADVTTPTAHYENIYYRMYLGQNLTTDFSIVRSTLYNLSLNFATNMISDEGWRIEPEDPVVIGTIALSKTSAGVIKGVDDVIYVTTISANDHPVEFDVSLDEDEADEAELSYTTYSTTYRGKEATAIRFSTTLPVDGLNSYDVSPERNARSVGVTITSKDTYNGAPIIQKTATVKVYHEAFPIYLKASEQSDGWHIFAYSNNPLSLGYEFGIKTYAGQDCSSPVRQIGARFCKYSYKPSGSSTWTTGGYVLSRSGREIGNIGSHSSYSGGLHLDITVKPISNALYSYDPIVYGSSLESPMFADGTSMYTGIGTEAYYGPGTSLAPGCFADFPDDASYNFTNSGTPSTSSYQGFSSLFTSTGGVNFKIDSGTTGWNRQNSYSVSEFGGGAPFYIVNAGLNPYEKVVTVDSPKYLDDSGRIGIEVHAYEPGRDLGIYTGTIANFGFKIGTMTQFLGNTHDWQHWKAYDYNIYMTINGCSSWPGAVSSAAGFSPGSYKE